MLTKIVFVAVIYGALLPASNTVSVEDVVDVMKLGREVVLDVLDTWNIVRKDNISSDESDLPFFKDREKKIMLQIMEVNRRIDLVGSRMKISLSNVVSDLMRELPSVIRLELRMDHLTDMLQQVDSANQQMQSYIQEGYENLTSTWLLEQHTLQNFASWCVSHTHDSVRSLMERIHSMIVPSSNKSNLFHRGVLALLQESMQETKFNICNLKQSPNQLLYNLYSTVITTELKGYTLMQFSWMLLKLYGKGDFKLESHLLSQKFQNRSNEKASAVKFAMKKADQSFWRCDPKKHIEGETYIQLTQLLQGHIQNEADMNSENSCRENCAYYSFAKSYGCYNANYCSKLPTCTGKIIDCQYIDSDMWISRNSSINSIRRLEWVEYENGRVLGKKDSKDSVSKIDSWWRWIFWHCSYCFCLCDQQGPNSDRYFNLRPVLANIASNKAVTGLRFIKKNRVFHVQIQEGSLLPRGEINSSTLEWKDPHNYKITDIDVNNGIDYHTMSWEMRAIDLDILSCPDGHIVTGIKFRIIGTHLNSECHCTPYNFTTGTLIKPLESGVWIANDNTDASLSNPRKKIYTDYLDIPTLTPGGSIQESKTDQYLLFTHTSIDTDAAQTTVPFLDAQPVNTEPPCLLTGLGLYYKRISGYGGFIAPQITTYDFAPHIQNVFNTNSDNLYSVSPS